MQFPGENHGEADSIQYLNAIKHNNERKKRIILLKDIQKEKPKKCEKVDVEGCGCLPHRKKKQSRKRRWKKFKS